MLKRIGVAPLREERVANSEFKVLLVEDDEVVAEMYRLALVAAGRTVLIARDGEEGLLMVSDEEPDFVVLDVRLPRLNGLEVLARLRTNPKTRELPVIILSNVGDPELLARGSHLGALEFMIKAQTTPAQLNLRIAEHQRWTDTLESR
jgi:two-component system phosphate regulon response regulator PhoB